jgi:hypothetical protein
LIEFSVEQAVPDSKVASSTNALMAGRRDL